MRVENAECTEKRSIVIADRNPRTHTWGKIRFSFGNLIFPSNALPLSNVDKNSFLSPPRGGQLKGGWRQGLVVLAEMPLEYLHFALKLASESLRTLWQEGEGGKEARENAGMPVAR